MNDNLKQSLNELLNSNGWIEVKKRFEIKLSELKDISAIDDTLPLDMQAVEIKANKKAIKIIESVLTEIKNIAHADELKKKIML
jgi:hypothetical protein